jgi:GntR family transcriptional regulator
VRTPRKDTNRLLPVPMYHQIYLVLREQIAEGHFDPTRPLPSEHELSAYFGVSRVTMRGALDKLEADGMISRQRGRGTFALGGRPVDAPRSQLSGLFENLITLGLKTTVKVIELDKVPAPIEVAKSLKLAPSEPVYKAVRVRSYHGEPISHVTTFVPEAVGKAFGRKELAAKPMLVLLEESGVKVGEATQSISAKLADAVVAPLLETELGAPLLSVTRLVSDMKGRPVQLLRGLYRADRYQYEMQLSRTHDERARVWVMDSGKSRSET